MQNLKSPLQKTQINHGTKPTSQKSSNSEATQSQINPPTHPTIPSTCREHALMLISPSPSTRSHTSTLPHLQLSAITNSFYSHIASTAFQAHPPPNHPPIIHPERMRMPTITLVFVLLCCLIGWLSCIKYIFIANQNLSLTKCVLCLFYYCSR